MSKTFLRNWACILIILVVGGCTSSETASSKSSTGHSQSSSSIAKESFAKRANAICQTMNEKLKALPRPAGLNDLSAVADYNEKSVAINEDGVKQIRALRQPPGDEATLNDIYTKLEKGLAVARRYIEALRSGVSDAEATQAVNLLISESNRLIAEANSAANAYGLVVCGQPAGDQGDDHHSHA